MTSPMKLFPKIALFVWGLSAVSSAARFDGFGRFGREFDDGLLTVNVSPDRLEMPSPVTAFSVKWGSATTTATVVSVDQTAKVLALSGAGVSAPSRVRQTLLYPGVGLEYTGNAATFTLSTSSAAIERIQTLTGSPTMHGVLVTGTSGGGFVPVVVAFRNGFNPATVTLSGTTLTVSDSQALGEVRLITPQGMRKFPASATAAQRDTLRSDAREWLRRGLPVILSRTATYDSSARTVTQVEDFATSNGDIFAPLPPVLAFAMQNGYPATSDLPVVRPTNLRTKYGPFALVEGSRSTVTLPLPPVDEWGFLRVNGETTRRALLNGMVGRLSDSWHSNGVDLGYVGKVPAQMAGAWLDTTRRNNLASGWSAQLPLAFRFPPYPVGDTRITWISETEPFTGSSYWWTYKIDGPQSQALDIEWGNLLPVYGLYKYAQYSGDWGFAQARWARVKDIARYTDLADDWAWMTNCNGDMGYSTGTGDPMTAAFAGNLALYKLARGLGQTADEAEYALRLARMTIPAVARFWYTDWARTEGYIGSSSVVLGFWERAGTFTTGLLSETAEDPWSGTNLISGNGVIPEFFAAVERHARTALQTYENRYAAAYPNWSNGSFAYSFTPLYGGNSVYVVFPHVFARYMLGEATAILWGYVDSSQANRGTTGWSGPVTVAALASRDTPSILTEWRPAKLVDAVYDAATQRATLDFTLPASAPPWSLTARQSGTLAPVSVTLNGTPIPFTVAGNEFRFAATASGSVQVVIQYALPAARVGDWTRY